MCIRDRLISMLGSAQLFSTALRPQSQGIVERLHRDLRASLAILADAFIRACPRKWPFYVRYLESKVRHKKLPTGDTPFSAVHGFRGSTALGSALGAIEEIPADLVWSDWLDSLVTECKNISERLVEHWAHEAEVRARKHGEQKQESSFQEGELVLIQKPFFERGTGAILPQCDGPFSICRLPTLHTAVLEDPLTGELFLQGKPVSVARLIRFHFPPDWAGPDAFDNLEGSQSSLNLVRGDMVACEPQVLQGKRVFVARIDTVHPGQELAQVTLFKVPATARFGPWQRRPWEIWQDEAGKAKSEIVTFPEVVCKVTLKDGALTNESLEDLARLGVDTGTVPSRDATLPSRH